MREDGYIKYNCQWIKKNNCPGNFRKLNKWRKKMYVLGLVGIFKNGIGFGNLSIRIGKGNKFLITGTATGGLKALNKKHYTLVTKFDLKKNELTCHGPIKASSESLSHAIIYKMDKSVNCVIHVHSSSLWKKLKNKIPTTSKKVAYGTPAMAAEIEKLFKKTDVKEKKIFVMAGHEDGVITFGRDENEAGKIVLKYLTVVQNKKSR